MQTHDPVGTLDDHPKSTRMVYLWVGVHPDA